jgi:O-antigen ligase
MSMLGRHPSEVFSGFAAFVAKFALMLLLVDLLEDFRMARAAVYLMLAAAAAFALMGIAQVTVFMLFGIDYSLSDIDYRFGQSFFGPSLRASGLSRTANQFAPPLVAAALIALSLAVSTRRMLPRSVLALLFLAALAAVLLSIVRGSWFALALGVALLPFIHRPSLGFHWAGLVMLVSVAAYASGLVTFMADAIVGLSAAGTAERWELLVAGINVMLESWNGVGIQNFSRYSPSFERYPVHNLFGQMGSELGLPGLVAIVALVGYVGLHLVQAIRAARDPSHRSLLCAMLGGYVGLLAATQSEPMAFSQFLLIYIGVAEACARTSLATSIANRPAAGLDRTGLLLVPARSSAT